MNIIPTLLTTTIEEFKEQIELFQNPFPRIQIDIADGKMVPNITTQISEIIHLIETKNVIINGNTSFDFHLMVQDYVTELQNILNIIHMGVKVDTILINAALNPNINELSAQYPSLTIGLDMRPETSVNSIAQQNNLKEIKAIQIMSVNPGFQGSPFLPEVLEKIQQLKSHDYRGEIFMDGGINDKTIPVIMEKEYAPDFLCIGSFLTKAGDKLEERIAWLKSLES